MGLKLTVSELSKITGVTPRNIRYYDSIGLFCHSGISENGYRYYSFEKIEELRTITYLRHLGISVTEIKSHLSNRNIDEYGAILKKQLAKVEDEIYHLESLKVRIQRRIQTLDYIRNLPELDKVIVQTIPERSVLRINQDIKSPIDWEKALIEFEEDKDIPPSIITGDLGFIVDLSVYKSRGPAEFTGIYMFANDPFLLASKLKSVFPAGKWLTIYFRGNHSDAQKRYEGLIKFADVNGLKLEKYALERTIVDHYISSNPDFYITEIQIPIVDNDF